VLGDLYPKNKTIAQPYSMGKKKELEIEKEYLVISESLDDLKNKSKEDKGNPLVKILRARQKIELLKIPTMVDLANDFMHQGFSVVIFVNFTDTLKLMAKLLFTKCLVYGEQNNEDRIKNIDNFQKNKERLIICNIKCGGVGISLHDLHGGHPRVSLISPSFSSIDLAQALGRIYRAKAMTPSLQYIVFCANTVEEKIAEKVKLKLKNISNINNGDLDLSGIIYENKPI
jgi:superfamily II DNA or RNA helicase